MWVTHGIELSHVSSAWSKWKSMGIEWISVQWEGKIEWKKYVISSAEEEQNGKERKERKEKERKERKEREKREGKERKRGKAAAKFRTTLQEVRNPSSFGLLPF